MIYSETPIDVRYAETDKMGVVYHANYAIWLEVARTDYIYKAGCRYGRGRYHLTSSRFKY